MLILILLVTISCSKEHELNLDVKSDLIENLTDIPLYFEDNKEYATTELVTKNWEESLKSDGFDVKLDNFQIVKEVYTDDSGIEQEVYLLRAESVDKKMSIGSIIKPIYVVDKTNKSQKITAFNISSKKCKCEGCTRGCNLSTFGGNCSCSPCQGFENQSCKKTEEETIE